MLSERLILSNIPENYQKIFGLPDNPNHPGLSVPHFGSYKEIRKFFKNNGIKTSNIDRIYETECRYLKRRIFDMPKWTAQWHDILNVLEAQIVYSRSICKIYIDAVNESMKIFGIDSYQNIEGAMYKKSKRNLITSSDIVDWSVDNHPLVVASNNFIDMMLNSKIPNDFSTWDLKPPYKNMIVVFQRDKLHVSDFYEVLVHNGKVYNKSELNKNPSIMMVHITFEYEPSELTAFRSIMNIESHIGILSVRIVIWLEDGMQIPMILDFANNNVRINDYIDDQFKDIKKLGIFIFSLILFYMSGPEESDKTFFSRKNSNKRVQINKKSEKIQIWKPIILGQKFEHIESTDPIDNTIKHKKRPHWRCGHFRKINKDVVWIKPTLVNAHMLRR